jgi:hypothetical protein
MTDGPKNSNWLAEVIERAKRVADAGPKPMKAGKVRHD